MTILSARLCGEPTINSYRAAAMMELLHVATLIHDDVIDNAKVRRNRATLHGIVDANEAILAGDIFFFICIEDFFFVQ